MMGSMFILFVIEMYLTAKVGGHSHGGATGDGTNNKSHHHPPAAYNGKKMVDEIDIEKQSAKMNASVTMREVKQEEARLEQNFLEVTAVSGEPMPAWFVVFYEQYIRQRIETINMLNSSSHTQQQLGYPLHRVSSFDSDITLLHREDDGEETAVDPQILRKMSLHITLLEGGILFHSIFVGITISITTDGFIILLVAILFHQMFEGVGLGSRIASVPYPSRSVRPWVLVAAFGLTCPIGQAIGLLTRGSYDPESSYGLITVGVFNAM
jgi:solute carrier family 39 (zinc transporter), member 1/2/3